jgi:hypothetical protein
MDKLSSSLGDVLTKKLVSLWEDLVAIVQGLILSNGEDQMVWKISDSGADSSQSLYAVLNFRGITLCSYQRCGS